MSGSLYQKPGKDSTEWLATKIAGGLSTFSCLGGFAIMRWISWRDGVVLVAAGAFVAAIVIAAYTNGRSKVKAAAEANRPPMSRVV